MKLKFALLSFVLATSASAFASKIVLPDSCGKEDIKFDVEKHKGGAPPVPPSEGHAQIVLIETMHRGLGYPDYTTRFGLDGTWIGAAKADSYFTFDIAPGEHHLCSSVQNAFNLPARIQKDMIGMTTFTAEAGKVYYYEFKIDLQSSQSMVTVTNPGGGMSNGTASHVTVGSGLSKLEDEEGRYRVKASDLATSKPKK